MSISDQIRALGSQYESEIIALRRHFHRHPELGAHEVETSAYVCEKLDELGVEYRRVTGHATQR